MRHFALIAAALTLSSVAFAPVAEAQSRKREVRAANARTLTVTPRSFLNPGNVVPVGSRSGYVYAVQYGVQPNFQGPAYQNNLPRPFEVPGRPFSPPAALSN